MIKRMVSLQEIQHNLSAKITLPPEFIDFYNWTVEQTEGNNSPIISGAFEWRSNKDNIITQWFDPMYADRFGVFGSGSTGNLYAFWIDDAGLQKIVHLDSEESNLLVLGHTFIEFLQYLAIGYSDPDITNFSFTSSEIDDVDYESISKDDLDSYYSHTQSLQTEEGFKGIFGDMSEEEIKETGVDINSIKEMFESIKIPDTGEMYKQLQSQLPVIAQEKERAIARLKQLQDWVKSTYKVAVPERASDLEYLSDQSFKVWVQTYRTKSG